MARRFRNGASLATAVFWSASALACSHKQEPDPPPTTGPFFAEASREAGLDYIQGPFILGMEDLSGGAAAGDYDGDGHVNLFVTRLGTNILFHNRGDGTFEDRTEAAFGGPLLDQKSMGAVWGDIDNDGDLDLYVTSLGTLKYQLYINDHGTFKDEAEARGAAIPSAIPHMGWGVTMGDFDQDGFLDLYVGEYMQSTASNRSHARLLRNLGATSPGHFVDVTDASGVNMDPVRGIPETGCSTTPFADPCQAAFIFSPRFSDVNGDGCPDLLIAADFGTTRLFLNKGDGTFANVTNAAGVGQEQNAMGSTIGDFDGDGDLDWFISAIYQDKATGIWGTSGNRLYANDGRGQYTDVTDRAGVRNGSWGWGTSWIDYDNDGHPDLVLTNGIPLPPFDDDPVRLWHNRGDGTFEDVAAAEGVTSRALGRGLLTFDYDEDGDLDVFIANHADRPVLYRNRRGRASDWLRVKVTGTVSNRDGYGAVVEVRPTAGSTPLIHEFSAGTNYLAQNENVAHFGLGRFKGTVASVTVRWPSGLQQTIHDVRPDQVLSITEDASSGPAQKRSCRGIGP